MDDGKGAMMGTHVLWMCHRCVDVDSNSYSEGVSVTLILPHDGATREDAEGLRRSLEIAATFVGGGGAWRLQTEVRTHAIAW